MELNFSQQILLFEVLLFIFFTTIANQTQRLLSELYLELFLTFYFEIGFS